MGGGCGKSFVWGKAPCYELVCLGQFANAWIHWLLVLFFEINNDWWFSSHNFKEIFIDLPENGSSSTLWIWMTVQKLLYIFVVFWILGFFMVWNFTGIVKRKIHHNLRKIRRCRGSLGILSSSQDSYMKLKFCFVFHLKDLFPKLISNIFTYRVYSVFQCLGRLRFKLFNFLEVDSHSLSHTNLEANQKMRYGTPFLLLFAD